MNAFNVLRLQEEVGQTTIVLDLADLKEIIEVNLKFFNLEDILQQEQDEYLNSIKSGRVSTKGVKEVTALISDKLELSLNEEDIKFLNEKIKALEIERLRIDNVFNLKNVTEYSVSSSTPSTQQNNQEASKQSQVQDESEKQEEEKKEDEEGE